MKFPEFMRGFFIFYHNKMFRGFTTPDLKKSVSHNFRVLPKSTLPIGFWTFIFVYFQIPISTFEKNYKERILLFIGRLLFEKIKKYSIMENVSYIKADNNKIINERAILWVRKLDRCLAICTKSIGCDGIHDTHRICKSKNPDSYNKLNKHFE